MYVHAIYIEKCTLNNFIFSTHPPPLLAGRVGLESMMKRWNARKCFSSEIKIQYILYPTPLLGWIKTFPILELAATLLVEPSPQFPACIARLPEPLRRSASQLSLAIVSSDVPQMQGHSGNCKGWNDRQYTPHHSILLFFFGVPTQSCDVTDRVFHGYFVTLQVDFHKLKDTCTHSFVVFVYECVWMIMRKLAFDVLNAYICMYVLHTQLCDKIWVQILLTNGIYRICWALSILPSKPSKSFTSCFPLSVSLSHF